MNLPWISAAASRDGRGLLAAPPRSTAQYARTHEAAAFPARYPLRFPRTPSRVVGDLPMAATAVARVRPCESESRRFGRQCPLSTHPILRAKDEGFGQRRRAALNVQGVALCWGCRGSAWSACWANSEVEQARLEPRQPDYGRLVSLGGGGPLSRCRVNAIWSCRTTRAWKVLEICIYQSRSILGRSRHYCYSRLL